jgi:hypothetical protein
MKKSSNPPKKTVQKERDCLLLLRGSATVGHSLTAGIFDHDGFMMTATGYQWQQLTDEGWVDIDGETEPSIVLPHSLMGQRVRGLASYTGSLDIKKYVTSPEVTINAQNPIVLENQKPGTNNWQIHRDEYATSEIEGYADAASINQGQAINFKISLAQAGKYRIDIYRLGYYGGTGGHHIVSITDLMGEPQAAPKMTNQWTRLVECDWTTSYTLQTHSDWVSGVYIATLTDSRTGKKNYIQFVLREDGRPADIGFQDAINTAAAYNTYGGYSTYYYSAERYSKSPGDNLTTNEKEQELYLPLKSLYIISLKIVRKLLRIILIALFKKRESMIYERAFQVSLDRPFQYDLSSPSERHNNTLNWEYNMIRWLESQGYDVSYYTNIDVALNPCQLCSQKIFLSVGHDEYWSMEQRNNVERARDNGINLAFFSANTAYWRIRLEPSSNGQENRVLASYKDTTGIGTGKSYDPIAQQDPSAATMLFRGPQINRPENALLGVGYTGDIGTDNVYEGFDFVVSNASHPYYAHTGLKNGDQLKGLVGYEWDSLLNNGATPAGVVVLSESPVPPQGLKDLGLLPSGTNDAISHSVCYVASSGAKVFSTGSVQWVWGLDSDRVPNPRVDSRAQQIAVNIFSDMGALPSTPNNNLINPRTGSTFAQVVSPTLKL